MSAYVERIAKACNDLRAIGIAISEEVEGIKLLSGLPTNFTSFIQSYNNIDWNVTPLSTVVAKLLWEAERMKASQLREPTTIKMPLYNRSGQKLCSTCESGYHPEDNCYKEHPEKRPLTQPMQQLPLPNMNRPYPPRQQQTYQQGYQPGYQGYNRGQQNRGGYNQRGNGNNSGRGYYQNQGGYYNSRQQYPPGPANYGYDPPYQPRNGWQNNYGRQQVARYTQNELPEEGNAFYQQEYNEYENGGDDTEHILTMYAEDSKRVGEDNMSAPKYDLDPMFFNSTEEVEVCVSKDHVKCTNVQGMVRANIEHAMQEITIINNTTKVEEEFMLIQGSNDGTNNVDWVVDSACTSHFTNNKETFDC